jgi:branched-chain amino acid transport system substrate-binding protein
MRAAILATGYGQDLLDQPFASQLGPDVLMQVLYAPVELKTKATKQFQADLKKYADYTGVPDYGIYTGYVAADLLVKGLQAAGKHPTRRGLIDGTRALGTFDQAGMACQPIDVSQAGFGKPPKTTCAWLVGIKDGKFVPGKIVTGTLIGESTAAAATTTAAP